MGRLTEQERYLVQRWFDDKTALIGNCPMCSHREWILGDSLVHAPEFTQPGRSSTFHAFPFFMIFCGHCGNTQFISAVMAGVVSAALPLALRPFGQQS